MILGSLARAEDIYLLNPNPFLPSPEDEKEEKDGSRDYPFRVITRATKVGARFE